MEAAVRRISSVPDSSVRLQSFQPVRHSSRISQPIAEALRLLQQLHRRRNYRPVADTIQDLLDATRAHVGFVLRSAGEQALANVLHVAELAREYEVDRAGCRSAASSTSCATAAEDAQAGEAPILEEGSDGVRLMTVHKAKGLEFPVVILADLTCKLARAEAGRWLDPERNVCALKIGGWAPVDLLLHDAEESARDSAESRAPDLRRRDPRARRARRAGDRRRPLRRRLARPADASDLSAAGASAPRLSPRRGCPLFKSKDSVLIRPEGDPASPTTVAPGTFIFVPRSPIPVPDPRPRMP